MTIPEAIIEATEKGMIGENLLCSNVPSLEKASKPEEASTRAEVAAKSSESANEKRKTSEEHVKIKGVDA